MFTLVKNSILPYQSVLDFELCLNYTTFASYFTVSQISELTECNKTSRLDMLPKFWSQNVIKELENKELL